MRWKSSPIVVGDGDCSSLFADVNTTTSVWDTTLLRASIVACAGSTWCLVGIASRAEVNQAVGSLTMVLCSSAVSLSSINDRKYKKFEADIQHQSSSILQHTWHCQS